MILYISGKITHNKHYCKEFKNAELYCRANGFQVLNTAKIGKNIKFLDYQQFMQLDYRLIDIADGVFVLKNYQTSLGATQEIKYAKQLDKRIIYDTRPKLKSNFYYRLKIFIRHFL